MAPTSHDLILFPCSASKKGARLSATPPARSITDFIDSTAALSLAEGRALAFARPRASLESESPFVMALALYSGHTYTIAGFSASILEALSQGTHCLIVSGGYGLVRPEEPIQRYNASMQHTATVWRPRLPNVLAEYIKQNEIARAFVACSCTYASALQGADWTRDLRETWWYIPRLPARQGAMVKIPRLVGESIVSLVRDGMTPDERWQRVQLA